MHVYIRNPMIKMQNHHDNSEIQLEWRLLVQKKIRICQENWSEYKSAEVTMWLAGCLSSFFTSPYAAPSQDSLQIQTANLKTAFSWHLDDVQICSGESDSCTCYFLSHNCIWSKLLLSCQIHQIFHEKKHLCCLAHIYARHKLVLAPNEWKASAKYPSQWLLFQRLHKAITLIMEHLCNARRPEQAIKSLLILQLLYGSHIGCYRQLHRRHKSFNLNYVKPYCFL